MSITFCNECLLSRAIFCMHAPTRNIKQIDKFSQINFSIEFEQNFKMASRSFRFSMANLGRELSIYIYLFREQVKNMQNFLKF